MEQGFNHLECTNSGDVHRYFYSLCCFITLICYLHWQLKTRKLSTLLKHVLYLTVINTVINTAIMMFATILAVYSICREKRQLPEASFVAFFDFFCAGEPFLCVVSALFQLFLSIRYQNHINCICCKRARGRLRLDTMDNQTNPTSVPINQPSHIYFSVPYTGAFTQVTSSQSVGEHTPVMVNNNQDSIIIQN